MYPFLLKWSFLSKNSAIACPGFNRLKMKLTQVGINPARATNPHAFNLLFF